MQIEIDGRLFQGTALQIVKAMQSMAFVEPGTGIPGYIAWMEKNAERLGDEPLNVKGSTDDELAESLLEIMIAKGYARSVQ
jgi:hypothetical protein